MSTDAIDCIHAVDLTTEQSSHIGTWFVHFEASEVMWCVRCLCWKKKTWSDSYTSTFKVSKTHLKWSGVFYGAQLSVKHPLNGVTSPLWQAGSLPCWWSSRLLLFWLHLNRLALKKRLISPPSLSTPPAEYETRLYLSLFFPFPLCGANCASSQQVLVPVPGVCWSLCAESSLLFSFLGCRTTPSRWCV